MFSSRANTVGALVTVMTGTIGRNNEHALKQTTESHELRPKAIFYICHPGKQTAFGVHDPEIGCVY
jgi:hypothetical protein